MKSCAVQRKVTDVLTKKRFIQKKSNLAAKIIAVGCASCVLTGCIGFGFASAGGGVSHDVESFGIDAITMDAAEAAALSDIAADADNASMRETTVLTSTASRDISRGIASIEAEEEAARRAAEEAARAEERARIAAAEQAKAEQEAAAAREAASAAAAALPDVDFTVGKEAFIAEWTARIDSYLAGSPLAGQGATFATAAWNNGVDPRWSPAISNTESTKGAHCFLPHNAWGWGSNSWSGWEEAINAHVAGLASGYGYSITYANAAKYCPPNTDHWYNATIAQMQMI